MGDAVGATVEAGRPADEDGSHLRLRHFQLSLKPCL
jgi:hypothetical protein